MAVSLSAPRQARFNDGALDRLLRSRIGPVGRDLQRRGVRVTTRMRQNATGRPGPQIGSSNLHAAIAFLRFDSDSDGVFCHIGLQNHRMIRRGYNYGLILEGLFPRGGAPPSGAYPFMERSLDAARD